MYATTILSLCHELPRYVAIRMKLLSNLELKLCISPLLIPRMPGDTLMKKMYFSACRQRTSILENIILQYDLLAAISSRQRDISTATRWTLKRLLNFSYVRISSHRDNVPQKRNKSIIRT